MSIKLSALMENSDFNELEPVKKEIAITEPHVNPDISEKYLCTVRNDEQGKNQLKVIREIFGPQYKIRVRGRHHNRKELLGARYSSHGPNEVPVAQAEFLAVYLYQK